MPSGSLLLPLLAAASVHAAELDAHRDEAPAERAAPDPARLAAGVEKSVDRVVYGYYPYWVADLDSIRWEALTHLAWFSIEIDATGAITAAHGWPDEVTVAAAHAAGVRVDLSFTLFSGSGILALTSDPARRAATIDVMIEQLELGDADGIAIDFEGLIDGTRDHFTTFIAELRAGLDAAGHPDAEISIAGPAVNWAGADGAPEFDLPVLLDHADYYFIMGYGYFWGGSSRAGPTGMLRISPEWRAMQTWSAERSIAGYASEVGAAKRRQILHGVPYYGREWITADGELGASVVDHVASVTYSAAMSDLSDGRTRRWDPGSRTPWYAWQDGAAWHQVWYDDVESLAAKYRLVVEQDLGGIGIWALNYDRPHADLWDLIEDTLGEPPVPEAGDRLDPLPLDGFPFHDERSTADAPGNYFDYYACAPETPEYGREWVYAIELCAGGRLDATVDVDAGADVDLHLLDALDETACLARDDAALAVDLAPGTYYLVVDTFVADLVTAEGGYRLDVAFTPSSGEPDCAGPDGMTDAGTGPAVDGDMTSGCGCDTRRRGDPLGALAVVLAALLALGVRARGSASRR